METDLVSAMLQDIKLSGRLISLTIDLFDALIGMMSMMSRC
jgi:hypothetical protein